LWHAGYTCVPASDPHILTVRIKLVIFNGK
jgi:hypothetical protein